jgi:NAD(P)-dependent dehydrogenase (short-subunit alcohol dehydrogenase family)
METDESVWNMMMDINLKGTFLSIKSAYPYLKKSQGNIVNIASDVSLVGSTSIPVYSITKAGVWMLTRLLASELAPAGIRVNAILPANITPGMKHTIKKDSEGKWVEVPENPEGPDWVKPPIGRFGTADEVASTVLFLASSEANYCTGSGLLVDGALNAAQP